MVRIVDLIGHLKGDEIMVSVRLSDAEQLRRPKLLLTALLPKPRIGFKDGLLVIEGKMP